MSKKLKIAIIIIVGILVLAIVGILILINSSSFKEKLIQKEMRALTEEFYSYYYDENNQDNNASNYLAQFKSSGLSITLADLRIYLESRTGKKYDSKKLEKCDIETTKTTIFPKEPFGKTDFDLTFELSCK